MVSSELQEVRALVRELDRKLEVALLIEAKRVR
jgi:hypothetical protein